MSKKEEDKEGSENILDDLLDANTDKINALKKLLKELVSDNEKKPSTKNK
ncbi:hypothetical protein MG296_01390 [Flavobacteriaceae bacterium TK19130]|nr:hypothetical protein [Thermobacterium salinum]